MSSANRRAALGALDRVRPLVEGLHRNRPDAELATDLTAAWDATEVVVRALMGGSTLAGQALVREARQRELLTLDQAHALVNFHAARDRAELPGYQVAAADVDAARTAVAVLDGALGGTAEHVAPGSGGAAGVPGGPGGPGGPGATQPMAANVRAPLPSPVPDAMSSSRSISPVIVIVLVALALVALPLGGWYLYANRPLSASRSVQEAAQLYARGERDRARLAFAEIVRKEPELALPHVYLARIAREQGDITVAQQELQTAIRLDPESAVAQREMGSLMLATGNAELARRFYRRAVELDPEDRAAQGFLGCALLRLGQVEVGQRFIQRAGPGEWSSCTAGQPPAQGMALPPAS